MTRENVLETLLRLCVREGWTRDERVKGGLSVRMVVGMLWELLHLVEGRLNRCYFRYGPRYDMNDDHVTINQQMG